LGVVKIRLINEGCGKLGHALDLHVAVLELPLVVGLHHTAPIRLRCLPMARYRWLRQTITHFAQEVVGSWSP
jgi:hypothetical protein